MEGMDSWVGTILKNRYAIEERIGQGSMSVVYLARDKEILDRRVVVKVLSRDLLDDSWVRTKFEQEMEALSRIDHPGVVALIDYGKTADEVPYLVLQHVEGVSLESEMRRGLLPLRKIGVILQSLAPALDVAHRKSVYHRDLKPANVMLQRAPDGTETARLIDFGVAKVRNSLVAESTKENVTAGTLLYMAPEQIFKNEVSCSSDIWSLGVLAYEMITGRRPFEAGTEAELHDKQRSSVPELPSLLRPGITSGVDKVILKALSYRPDKRFQSASAFSAALATEFSRDPNVRLENTPGGPSAVRPDSRYAAWVLPTALLTLVGSLILWLFHTGAPDVNRETAVREQVPVSNAPVETADTETHLGSKEPFRERSVLVVALVDDTAQLSPNFTVRLRNVLASGRPELQVEVAPSQFISSGQFQKAFNGLGTSATWNGKPAPGLLLLGYVSSRLRQKNPLDASVDGEARIEMRLVDGASGEIIQKIDESCRTTGLNIVMAENNAVETLAHRIVPMIAPDQSAKKEQ